MSVLGALARLEAVRAGRAQPIASVCHYHVSTRPLVLIPLRLAGEAAAPLAVLAGSAPEDAQVLIVPQPRDRVLRLRFVDDLASLVLLYISTFSAATVAVEKKSGEIELQATDAPQLWVPNPGGVEFLRLLGRSVRFQPTDGPNAVPETTPLLGRWLTFFADRAEHPGSGALLAATTVLSGQWASGQSALEDANLAALLGWIDPPPGRTGAQAAASAEDPLISPPAGPATDPGFDNEELAPLVAAYDTATDNSARTIAAQRLESALRGQLEPTWTLMWQALRLLGALPEGASVPQRWAEDRRVFSWYVEQADEGVPQARRDSAVRAARRLLNREQALETFSAQRAFDDPQIMAEHRLAGTAFRGTVVEADASRLDTTGARAVLRPHIRVHTRDPIRADIEDTLFSVERPKQEGRVVEIADGTILLELKGGMGRKRIPEEGTVPGVGEVVVFAQFSPSKSAPRAKLPALEDTPWTHGGPPPEWIPPESPVGAEAAATEAPAVDGVLVAPAPVDPGIVQPASDRSAPFDTVPDTVTTVEAAGRAR